MKPMSLDVKHVTRMLFAIAWLCGLAIVNYHGKDPIDSILPYLFPVMLIAWCHGVTWGFLFAALATLAAIPVDHMAMMIRSELNYGVLVNYAKLTGAAVGAHIAHLVFKSQASG
jgi:hypothetical protein